MIEHCVGVCKGIGSEGEPLSDFGYWSIRSNQTSSFGTERGSDKSLQASGDLGSISESPRLRLLRLGKMQPYPKTVAK